MVGSGKFLIVLTAVLIAGCGTIFDFAPVPRKKNIDRTSLSAIAGEAEELAEKYQSRAAQAANSVQAFDVPIIAAAITGVTALAFGAHSDVALVAGAVGGGSAAYRTYYNP